MISVPPYGSNKLTYPSVMLNILQYADGAITCLAHNQEQNKLFFLGRTHHDYYSSHVRQREICVIFTHLLSVILSVCIES